MSTAVAARFLILLLGASLKASLVFALVFAVTYLLRDSLPAQRHLLWFGAISSYFLILLFSFFGPQWLPVQPSGPATPDAAYANVSTLLLSSGGILMQSGSPVPAMGKGVLWEPVWAIPVLFLWAAGVLVSFLRVAVGGIRLRLLVAESRRCRADEMPPGYELACRELAAAVGVHRPVRVMDSRACQVPFASGIFRPLIMLPSSASGGSVSRLRAVLVHELRHIQRWDFLTQAIARWICSLFWFVPFPWIACSFLYAEQEKACDAAVLEHGVAPSDYAACLLEAAQHEPQAAALAGLYPLAWRKRVLVDRIQRIIQGGRAVKKKWVLFASTVFVVCALVVLGGMGGKQPLSEEEAYQRFVGTFVNTEYPGTLSHSQVKVIRPDFVGEDWLLPDSTKPDGQWTIKVKKTWVDREGSTYVRFFRHYLTGDYCNSLALMRVDKAGKVWECFSAEGNEEETARYPENLIKGAPEYYIYYRK